MMRLLAALHRPSSGTRTDGDRASTRRSVLIGVISSGVVLAHLVALGVAGTFLFVRSGEGYSTAETVLLAMLAVIAIVAFGHVGAQVIRNRHARAGRASRAGD